MTKIAVTDIVSYLEKRLEKAVKYWDGDTPYVPMLARFRTQVHEEALAVEPPETTAAIYELILAAKLVRRVVKRTGTNPVSVCYLVTDIADALDEAEEKGGK